MPPKKRRYSTATELLARQQARLLDALRAARIAAWHLLAFKVCAFRLSGLHDVTPGQDAASQEYQELGEDAAMLRRLLERFLKDGSAHLPTGLKVGEGPPHWWRVSQSEHRRLSRLLRSWFDQPAADTTGLTDQPDD